MEFAWDWERRQFKKEVVRTSDAVERPGRKKSQRISLQGHVGVTRTVWRLGLVDLGTGYRMMKKLISTLMLLFQGWTIERKTISRETEMYKVFFFKFKFIFNWRIIDLQYVDFCQTSTWVSHRYMYVCSLLRFPPTSHHFTPLRLSQSTRFKLAMSI